jgi:hypothetical protein
VASPGGAAKKISAAPKLSQKGFQAILDFIDHTEGVRRAKGVEVKDLKANAQMIADRLGLEAFGSDKDLANKLRQFLDFRN